MEQVKADLSVRRAGPEDVERILELARLSLGTGDIPRDRDYWDWKHLRSPFGASPVLIAEVDQLLVGLRVFMRWEWLLEGQRVRAVRAVDTATHPDWQGKGIFSRLTRALVDQTRTEGVDLIFNTPNAKSGPGYLKMGWSAVGRVDLLIKPIHPLRIAAALVRGATGGKSDSDSGAPLDRSNFDDFLDHAGIEELLRNSQQHEPSSRFSTPRSKQYLRWRYSANPAFRYHAIWEPEDVPRVAIIYRTRRRGSLTELRICEILTGQSPADALRSGRRIVRRLEGTVAADYISAMATPRTPAWFALAGAGFLPAPRLGPLLTVRRLQDNSPGIDPIRRRSWSLSIGDLELF